MRRLRWFVALFSAGFSVLVVPQTTAQIQSASAAGDRALWPVALTGLRDLSPVFCRPRACGVGAVATSALYPTMVFPYPHLGPRNEIYVSDNGNPGQPIRVIGLNGRIERVVRVPGGVSRLAVSATGKIAVNGDGNVIREVSPTGSTRIVAGDHPSNAMTQAGPEDCACGDGGPARKALLLDVSSIAYDSQGRIVLADSTHYRIRRIEKNGTINTIVGAGTSCSIAQADAPCSPSGSTARSAKIYRPINVAFAPDGTLWFTIERFKQDPVIAHVDRHGKLSYRDFGPITGLAVAPDGGVYTVRTVVDGSLVARGRRAQILRIDPKTLKAQVAVGAPLANGCLAAAVALTCGDGSGALTARLDSPDSEGLAFDRRGGLYIGGPGQEIRYLPDPRRQAIRLSLAIAAVPAKIGQNRRLTVRYVTTMRDARVSMQIAVRRHGRVEIVSIRGFETGSLAGTISWDGKIRGHPAPPGIYALQLTAVSRARISTRQAPFKIVP